MEVVVIWSDSAIEDLREIYDYYYYKASERIADKILKSWVKRFFDLPLLSNKIKPVPPHLQIFKSTNLQIAELSN